MLAVIIVVALVAFDAHFIIRQWRASRIKQKRALRLRAMSGVVDREAR
jgi:hypothetical protein